MKKSAKVDQDFARPHAFVSVGGSIMAKKLTTTQLSSIVDSVQPVALYNDDLKIVYCNPAYCQLVGLSPTEIMGKHCYEVIPGVSCHTENCTSIRAKKEGKISFETRKHILSTDRYIPAKITAIPIKDSEGNMTATLEAITDLTEQEAILERDEAIRKMSTPLVDTWENIVLIPLIGILDTTRARQITESILERIAKEKSQIIVILSIGGIATIDTKAANHILKTVHAVKLMGSEMIITGVRPDVAATLVTLGIDLTGIVTRSHLREGLEYAFDKLGWKVTKNS